MAKKKTTKRNKAEKMGNGTARLKSAIDKRIEGRESAVDPWRFLVRRKHP